MTKLDFSANNADNQFDIVLRNTLPAGQSPSTRTAIWDLTFNLDIPTAPPNTIGNYVPFDYDTPNWQIGGAGDFNGDGKTDLVLQNQTTRQQEIWLMDGINRQQTIPLSLSFTNPQLGTIRGVADFNGDGNNDILWSGQGGNPYVWEMQGTTFTGGNSQQFINEPVPGQDWVIGGTGDFNGDGQTDIVWNNDVTGANRVWFMDQAYNVLGQSVIPSADPNWFMAGSGQDFDNNGTSDILWSNPNSFGDHFVWLMDQNNLQSFQQIDLIDPGNGWQIVAQSLSLSLFRTEVLNHSIDLVN